MKANVGQTLEIAFDTRAPDRGQDPLEPIFAQVPSLRDLADGLRDLHGAGGPKQLEVVPRLTDGDRQLVLTGRGFVCSTLLFGMPGVGKTNTILHFLDQYLMSQGNDPKNRVGALVLDPKDELGWELDALLAKHGRKPLNLSRLELEKHGVGVNLIDSVLDTHALSEALMVAAKGAGKLSQSEDFWTTCVQNLIKGVLGLLELAEPGRVTMRALLRVALSETQAEATGRIEELAQLAKRTVEETHAEEGTRERLFERIRKLKLAAAKGAPKDNGEDRTFNIVQNLLMEAFGAFADDEWEVFSDPRNTLLRETPSAPPTDIYRKIIDDGEIVVVTSLGREAGRSKVLQNLVKSIFQTITLARKDYCRSGELQNRNRLLLLVADEYSDVASQVFDVGDVTWVQKCRSMGCAGVFAVQGLTLLENASGLNVAGQGSRAGDLLNVINNRLVHRVSPEDAALFSERFGTKRVLDVTLNAGAGFAQTDPTRTEALRDVPRVEAAHLSGLLRAGEALFVGVPDGSVPVFQFVRVPAMERVDA